MTIPIIVLVGPTAVGKTEISIKLAKKYNCEIISVDSVQIYKGFDIGSAKITEEEMQGVTHHLIDFLEADENFSVYEFQKIAREKIREIYEQGKIPLLTGGTGFYMNAVINDYRFVEYNSSEEVSIEEQLEYLKNYYPETYNSIDINNDRRIISAFKYVTTSSESYSDNTLGQNVFSEYNPYVIVLDRKREHLYSRINKRVELMVESGLVDEVNKLVTNYGKNLQGLTAIGYKEVVSYLDKEISQEEMVNSISQNSRRYAKRQLTWFRNKTPLANWYNLDIYSLKDIEKDIDEFLGNINENK